jgi:dTDP-glucose 4,6-dehydratase
MTILEFAQRIRERFGNGIGIEYRPLPSDDPKIRRPDITKAKSILGWTPAIPLEEGLTVTIEYFKNKASEDSGALQGAPGGSEPSSSIGVL